jgi:hypothetical protein
MRNRPAVVRLVSFLCFSLVIISCRERRLSLPELKAYATEPAHGLIQRSEHDGIIFELIYRPKELIVQQNVENTEDPLWDSVAAQLTSFDYFIMRISKNKREIEASFAGDPSTYTKVTNYLNGTIGGDLSLVVDNETVKTSEVLFSPAYGMASASSILVVFNSNLASRNSDFTVVLKDTQFGTGRHEFDFEIEAIHSIPQVR